MFISFKKRCFYTLILLLFILSFKAYPIAKYAVTENGINIRIDSTVSAVTIGRLIEGEEIEAIDKRFEWYKIKLPRRFSCYVAKKFIKPISKSKAVVTATALNLRSEPSLESYVIGKVKKGEFLYTLRDMGEWVKVRGYPYTYGWTHENFLRKLEGQINDTEIVEKEEIDEIELTEKEEINEIALAKKEEIFEDTLTEIKMEETSFKKQSLADIIDRLKDPSMARKKDIHETLIKMGPEITPVLESSLLTADTNTTYSIIFILGKIGQNNFNLAFDFLIKTESTSDLRLAAAYLDIVQNILKPQGVKNAYLYMVDKGELNSQNIEDARNFLFNVCNKQLSLRYEKKSRIR
jgi:uncharacterized protein YgiM (DUF1202 family)